jgi:hypothetical protein
MNYESGNPKSGFVLIGLDSSADSADYADSSWCFGGENSSP